MRISGPALGAQMLSAANAQVLARRERTGISPHERSSRPHGLQRRSRTLQYSRAAGTPAHDRLSEASFRAIGDVGVFTLGAASFAAAALIVLTIGVETRGRTVEEICRAEEEAIANPT